MLARLTPRVGVIVLILEAVAVQIVAWLIKGCPVEYQMASRNLSLPQVGHTASSRRMIGVGMLHWMQ